MGTFALQIAQWVEKTKGDLDKTVRLCALSIDGKLIQRSPVGDPSKWKYNPNKPKVFGKFSAAGPKKNWQEGFVSKGKSNYSMSGAGYVGGRFRGAWMLSIGSPSSSIGTAIDPTGDDTKAAHAATVAGAKAGDVVYFQNNMPYAQRLEQGWSKQAPIGMVALTVVEWSNIVDNVVNGIRSGTSAEDFSQGFKTYSL
jgi:hypothetical protein